MKATTYTFNLSHPTDCPTYQTSRYVARPHLREIYVQTDRDNDRTSVDAAPDSLPVPLPVLSKGPSVVNKSLGVG